VALTDAELTSLPKGFRWAGVRCGLKNKRNDLGILQSEVEAAAAGVFTQNTVRAACVDYDRSVVANGRLRAVVVNSGNANCCTGEQGVRDTERMASLTAEALGLAPADVAVASTGVIGHVLNMAKVEKGIKDAAAKLGDDPRPFQDAILTTDLVEKHASAELAGGARVFGVAKGSGMIAPNMATMLAFVVTDSDTSGQDLQSVLERGAEMSFNRMTVDTDTSTNDTLLLLANGASGVKVSEAELQRGVSEVLLSLAKQVARDGEGATKLIEVVVRGSSDPVKVARSIADSPLFKTAMFGCDPNWGRVMMAAGKTGVPFELEHVELKIQASGEEHVLFEDGAPAPFDAKRVSAALKDEVVRVLLRLEAERPDLPEAVIYTCDLGYGYVRINAEYHT
jgi:glutamate N-acetyltransferase/amino-acid N-acetyltransferase